MEGDPLARESSGIYIEDLATSVHTFNTERSTVALRGHIATPGSMHGDVNVVDPFDDPFNGSDPFAASVNEKTETQFQSSDGARTATAAIAVAHKPPLCKRRWFRIAFIIGALLGVALLFIILFPVVKAIIQYVVNEAELDISTAAIINPSNASFTLAMQGLVTHTGIFSAVIKFTQPVNVSWIEGSAKIPLGYMNLAAIYATHKRATINDTTTFHIIDQEAFARFTSYMITSQNFTWQLESVSLSVQAEKFPWAHGITFNNFITLNGGSSQASLTYSITDDSSGYDAPGTNNFIGNVLLEDLQLPSDNRQGGIDFVAVTRLTNPSPFALSLGTIVFDLTYQGVYLGSGTGTNTEIVPGNNNITLKGVLIPQTNSSSLAAVSQLFTNYLNFEPSPVVASGQSTLQADGLRPPVNPIQSITIGSMALAFLPEAAWTPRVDSDSIQASMKLPFGFNISIAEIQNQFYIVKNDSNVARLATPLGASTPEIQVLGPTDTEGTIDIKVQGGVLNSTNEERPKFAAFNTELTDSSVIDFLLIGNSSAIANMSIGQITLNPIKVNVSTSLKGLQGLKGHTTIGSVDVLGGTAQSLNLSIEVFIYNPSNLQLSTGDLQLQLGRGGAILGTSLLPNFTLHMGNNTMNSITYFEPNSSPQGLETLSEFVGGTDVELVITGYENSTQVDSLLPAFESVNITTTLPGLNSNLLSSGALEILTTTFHTNNVSQVTVALANPFTASFSITGITSTVTSHNLSLGSIDMPAVTDFSAAGKATTMSPPLALNMNYDPPTLFTLTRVLALQAGLDVAPLDGIVALGGYEYVPSTNADSESVSRGANLYTGFDLPTFVDMAFKQLRIDVHLSAGLAIGDYQTTLNYTQLSVPITTDSSLNLILPVLAQPIVQRIVGASVLGIDTVIISDLQLTSFGGFVNESGAHNAYSQSKGTQLNGSIKNAGPFDATISFGDGLTISWNGQRLGLMQMGDVNVTGDVGATLNVQTTFEVSDVDLLAKFTKEMQVLLNNETFTWDVSGDNLTVSALGIVVSSITLPTKSITLKGFNGLKNGVQISSFDLPANDPADGITLMIQSELTNPSQVGIELSSIAFTTFADNIEIAAVASSSAFTLFPGSTSSLPLAGRLIPQSSGDGLAAVSVVFNNFIHGLDSNVMVEGASAGPTDVTWLNEGIQTLQIDTTLPNQGKLNIIESIVLEELELLFTNNTAYDPMATSNATTAAFTLPFGFPVDIVSLEQNITVGYDDQTFAELVIPNTPCTTNIQTRVIYLTFSDIPFTVFINQHGIFQNFLAATTAGSSQTVVLSGASNAAASTAVGLLSLNDIEFTVNSTVEGLQGLSAKPMGSGYTSLYNPSNLTIGTGDVTFILQFDNENVGFADLSNLIIQPGQTPYATDVLYYPQGSAATAAGQTLLENYIQGVDSNTTILGTMDSTTIDSLKLALSEILLSPVTIPAMHQNLITSASLEFPLNIAETGVSSATFTLSNPFTASINLLQVTANATFQNLTVGSINHIDLSSNPITASGHTNVTSPSLPFEFNLDPLTIIELISVSAKENEVDLGPLSALFQLVIDNPDYHPPVKTSIDTSSPSCRNQFDVDDAILNALKGLQVELAVDSSVRLDDYITELAFIQKGVTADTDRTALYLIGVVAAPIARELVNNASLSFSEANITGFKVNECKVCAAANTGVPDYQTSGKLTITDQARFTAYATYILHNPSFEWTISTSQLRVTALGTIFDDVSLTKTISLRAFDNLSGITIFNFQLPSNDPAGGITIITNSLIPSPAQLGIDLGTVEFLAYFQDTLIGPLSADDLILAPESQTTTLLSGHMIPQSGNALTVVGKLFSEYLGANNITLSVKGSSAQPTGSSTLVAWLDTAFKTLILNVTLPGQKFDIIQFISLSDLNIVMENQNEAFAPLSASNNTVAEYKNPFGFSLQVVQSAVQMILSSGGAVAAELTLPLSDNVGGVSTGNVALLPISFDNVPLQALDDAAFEAMFAQVTDRDLATFNLSGTVDVTAKTAIGNVPISGIPFSVLSSVNGINSFGGTASIRNVSISGSGGNQYIISPLTTTLQNLSNTYITVNAFNPFDLVPGDNSMQGEFQYEPADASDTVSQSFLTSFIQSGDILPLSVKGDATSTPFTSLQLTLEGVTLSTSVTGLNVPPIITHVYVTISLDSLVTNEIEASFDASGPVKIYNPLDADLVIEFVQADGMVNGEIYTHFDQAFSNYVIPLGKTVNSGTFGNVKLVKGALESLQIIPLGYLDIQTADTVRVGVNGYQIPWLHVNQNDVAITYSYNLISLAGLLSAAQSMTAPHASATLLSSLSGGLFTGSSAAMSSHSLIVNVPTSVASSLAPSFTGNAAKATNETLL
ncbi:hypothetical protein EDD17DRAFT_1748665 [Pisolithus thermaeus]|nr:hypothetical protein EDD17DRAFT_1748665 [Pisolithus thermaeus]